MNKFLMFEITLNYLLFIKGSVVLGKVICTNLDSFFPFIFSYS